jgi:enamine deaminase RidA (YjgF/YER057c/UK114 family)
LRRIADALDKVGAGLTDVVRTRMYVTNISQWRDVGAVHAECSVGFSRVSTMVEVSALISPELLVEVEAEAYVGD